MSDTSSISISVIRKIAVFDPMHRLSGSWDQVFAEGQTDAQEGLQAGTFSC